VDSVVGVFRVVEVIAEGHDIKSDWVSQRHGRKVWDFSLKSSGTPVRWRLVLVEVLEADGKIPYHMYISRAGDDIRYHKSKISQIQSRTLNSDLFELIPYNHV